MIKDWWNNLTIKNIRTYAIITFIIGVALYCYWLALTRVLSDDQKRDAAIASGNVADYCKYRYSEVTLINIPAMCLSTFGVSSTK